MPPTIYTNLRDSFPALAKKSRYLEYLGGLGDILNHLHWLSCYRDLDTLQAGERAYVLVSSHNVGSHELFLWHPKADQIDLCNPGFFMGIMDPAWRHGNGLPPQGCSAHPGPLVGPVTYYPSPKDMELLDAIPGLGKYIVFSLTAGESHRSIPQGIAAHAAAAAVKRGFKVVLVGRNYTHDVVGHRMVKRQETRLPAQEGVFDTIDKLSVPGMARLLEGAAGVFSCHSATCLLSWSLLKPTFLLYDNHARDVLVPLGPYGYMNGMGRPDGDSMHFLGYTSARFELWMERL